MLSPETSPTPDSPSASVRTPEPKSLIRKLALAVLYLIFVCAVIAGYELMSLYMLQLGAYTFAAADAAGAPGFHGGLPNPFSEAAGVVLHKFTAYLALIGILLSALCLTFILYKKKVYLAAIVAGLLLLVIAAPIGRTAYYQQKAGYERPDSANPVSYKSLNPRWQTEYAVDNQHVYCDGNILPGADPSTLAPLTERETDPGFLFFAKDNQHVYYRCNVVAEADPATFHVLNVSYELDAHHAFFLQQLGDTSNSVPTIIPDADPNTFALVGLGAYAKDKNHVYDETSIVPLADPATFEYLSSGYAKDKSHVYFRNVPIPQADLATFVLIDHRGDCGTECSYEAKDKNYFYDMNGKTTPR